jgi:hypothetical protein
MLARPADPLRVALRAGFGLGDSLYLQSIARHLCESGQRVEVCSAWPDVFRPLTLAGRILLSPFRRERIDRVAHYTSRKQVAGTSQFEDSCIAAGISGPVDLRLDWTLVNPAAVAPLRRTALPVVLVQLPRAPMGRTDGFGAELLPDCRVIQRTIDMLEGKAFRVQIGSGAPLYHFTGIDLDLANKTSVCDLIDIASVAGGFLGYCSFIVPLAESLGKPALLVWSRRGLNSQAPRGEFIRSITPEKVLHRATSRAAMDDCSRAELARAAHDLLDAIASPAPL